MPKLHESKISFVSLFIPSLLVLLLFLPALQNGFVNWDDNFFVYENKNIQSMGTDFWSWAFRPYKGNWIPLTWLSHAIDYVLFKHAPWGHHLTSIFFHACNTFLFILIVFQLISLREGNRSSGSQKSRISLPFTTLASVSAGLFFGLSPVRVESVVWISERKDVLFLFFGLLSTHCYLKCFRFCHLKNKKATAYLMSLAFFMCGLMSKSMLVTLPVVFLILDYYPLERFNKKSFIDKFPSLIWEKMPFFILSAIICYVTIVSQATEGAVYGLESKSVVVRFTTSVYAYSFYIIKMLAPKGLTTLYLIRDIHLNICSPRFLGSLVLLLVLTGLSLFMMKKTKIYATVWGYFIVTMLPVSGIIQTGQQFAADRYTYYPGLGFAILFGLLFGKMVVNFSQKSRGGRIRAMSVLFLIVVYSVINILVLQRQICVWKDSITLWNRQISLYPKITSQPYKNRGVAHFDAGNHEQAIADFTTAIRLKPNDHTIYVNRGATYHKIKDYDRAVADFVTAARMGNLQAIRLLDKVKVPWRETLKH